MHTLPGLFSQSTVGTPAFFDTVTSDPILQNDFLANGMRPVWGVMPPLVIVQAYNHSGPVFLLNNSISGVVFKELLSAWIDCPEALPYLMLVLGGENEAPPLQPWPRGIAASTFVASPSVGPPRRATKV